RPYKSLSIGQRSPQFFGVPQRFAHGEFLPLTPALSRKGRGRKLAPPQPPSRILFAEINAFRTSVSGLNPPLVVGSGSKLAYIHQLLTFLGEALCQTQET